MSNLYDAHPLRTTMGDFIDGLCRLKSDTITKSRVAEFVAAADIQAEALSPYIFWRESGYTRNLIYRDDWFEVMAICWGPGQKTPVHTHNGQLGWMTVVQGELLTRSYEKTIQVTVGKKTVDQTVKALAVELKADTIKLLEARGHKVKAEGYWSDGECIAVDPRTGDLLGAPDIDGALVGGASLDPESFAMIIEAAG